MFGGQSEEAVHGFKNRQPDYVQDVMARRTRNVPRLAPVARGNVLGTHVLTNGIRVGREGGLVPHHAYYRCID
jgi:hypothetical protein